VTVSGLQFIRWDGTRRELGECWRLRKGSREARCAITTHPSHWWELRLEVDGDLIQSEAFSDQNPLLETVAEWKAKMLGAGWEDPPLIEEP
jgi:hypothetical protein